MEMTIIKNYSSLDFNGLILYKYRSWEDKNHRNLLEKGQVFFASPNSFEDSFDCNLPEKLPEQKDLFDFFFEKSKEMDPYLSFECRTEFAKYWSVHSSLANKDELGKVMNDFRTAFNDRHGILSLCKSPSNEKMWTEYGNNHSGFCVGIDAMTLFKYCNAGGTVDYIEGTPYIDFSKDSIDNQISKEFFCKSSKYCCEDEYRFIIIKRTGKLQNSDRIVTIPPEGIKEVYLGSNMDIDKKNSIIEIVKSKYPNARVLDEIQK